MYPNLQFIDLSPVLLLLVCLNLVFGWKKDSSALYCGIVGYCGKKPFNSDKLKMLMLYNEERGSDSAGFYVSNKEFPLDERVFRTLGKVSETMLPSHTFGISNMFIGHTRKSTCGASSLANAHPFVFRTAEERPAIIGVHNGSLSNRYDLFQKYNETLTTLEVDSMLIFKQLQASGTTNILSELGTGTNALLYTYDDGILYAYRMTDRPLFRAEYKNEDGDLEGIYISSIKDSLLAIGCEPKHVKEFKDGYLYTLQDGRILGQRHIKRDPYAIPTVPTTSANYSSKRAIASSTSDFEEEPEITFTKCYFLGDDTRTSGIVGKILQDSGILFEPTEPENLMTPHLNTIDTDNETDFDEGLYDKLTEFMLEVKHALKVIIVEFKDHISHEKVNITSVKSSIHKLEILTESLNSEIEYMQLGDEECFEKANNLVSSITESIETT